MLPVLSYIDPNTMHNVFTFLGPLLAFFAAGAGIVVSAFLFFRRWIVAWFKKASDLKLFIVLTVFALAVAVLGLCIFFYIFESRGNMSQTGENKIYKRCLVLGMDGLDWQIVTDLIKNGKLPNFARLAETGTFAPLRTSNPAMSPIAWSDIATGAGPEYHGLFDFLHRDPKNYMPYLSIRKNSMGIFGTRYENARQCDGFWKIVGNAGIPATVIRWPVTFPAEKVSGRFLSGLGVPDLLGSEGQYFFYTTKSISDRDPSPDNVVCVTWDKENIWTFLKGPMMGKYEHSELPLVIKRQGSDSVTIHLANEPTIEASRGEWTPWVKTSFKIGLRRIHGIVKFLLLESKPDLKLFVYPVNIDAGNQAFPITYPAAFGRQLEEKMGKFHTLGMPELVHPLSHNRYGFAEFLSQVEDVAKERTQMFFNELDRFDDGLLAFVFDHTDRIQHALWATRDVNHPAYDENDSRLYGRVIDETYQQMDNILGKTIEKLDEETAIFIVSDHGFGSFRRQVHLNRWLIENGYMHLKVSDGQEGQGLFKDVDWRKSRAYAVGFASIYINLAGREGKGIVKAGVEYDMLCREIAERLKNLIDTEKNCYAVHQVYRREQVYSDGPLAEDGPDILVGFKVGYRFSWQTAIGAAPVKIFEDNNSKWSGDHIFAPELVPGIFLSNIKISAEKIRCIDMAPTVLDCLGVTKPGYMTGTSLFRQ